MTAPVPRFLAAFAGGAPNTQEQGALPLAPAKVEDLAELFCRELRHMEVGKLCRMHTDAPCGVLGDDTFAKLART
jgi:hypothetical protein